MMENVKPNISYQKCESPMRQIGSNNQHSRGLEYITFRIYFCTLEITHFSL